MKRYECNYEQCSPRMCVNENGDYVLYKEAQAEIAALNAESDRLTAMVTQQSQGTTEQECQHEYRLERVGAGIWFACQKCGEILDED